MTRHGSARGSSGRRPSSGPSRSPRPAACRSPSSGRSASRSTQLPTKIAMIAKPMSSKSRWPTQSQIAAGQVELLGDDAEHLDAADHERDQHRHERDVQVVVELADGLDVGPAVGAQHQIAVRGVDERHARGEQRRQDEDVARSARASRRTSRRGRAAPPRWPCRSRGRTGRRADTCASSCGSSGARAGRAAPAGRGCSGSPRGSPRRTRRRPRPCGTSGRCR